MAPIQSLDPDASFKHWIADDLRFWREREGLSLSQMGQVMGCSRHTVSNIEHARDGWNMNEDHADKLDAHFRLNHHFRRLVRYARTAHDPDWFADYVKHEKRALVIRTFRLSLFPGLLQTEAYARALLTSSRLVKDVEGAVRARMQRQEVLTRDNPPNLWAVVDENVLYRPVGGPDVMREQIARLHEAAMLPNVTIRFVQQSAGYYLGLDGSFNTLSLERGDQVFVEAPGGGRLVQADPEVREFGVRWDRIGASALPWDTSRELMAQAMERL
ncbi:helix-turn-helix domain-containing protein [Actinomadura macra]|uniref:helix-turn-helix domain-containing protein n=1 Tax=Actinomadura macra TaxID=46164 RepID=UPI00082CB87B|nr:helix-turn-helix transcriptional regulator [Actinomadura macra]